MIMDILLISECFLIIALIVFSFATLRIITYKSISMRLKEKKTKKQEQEMRRKSADKKEKDRF